MDSVIDPKMRFVFPVCCTSYDENKKRWVAFIGYTDGLDKDHNNLNDLASNNDLLTVLKSPYSGDVVIQVVDIEGIFCLVFRGNGEGGRYYNPRTISKRVVDTSIQFAMRV